MSTGPGEHAGHGRMRAGHADREQVITELKAAFVQGRLDQDELEERAGRAVASRTYGELAALTADIPAAAETPAPARAGTPGRTLAKAARRAGACLLAAVALAEAALLSGNFLLAVAATFAALATAGFLGYGILDAVHERRARARLAPGQGLGPGRRGTRGRPGPPRPAPPRSPRRPDADRDPRPAAAAGRRPSARLGGELSVLLGGPRGPVGWR